MFNQQPALYASGNTADLLKTTSAGNSVNSPSLLKSGLSAPLSPTAQVYFNTEELPRRPQFGNWKQQHDQVRFFGGFVFTEKKYV